MWRLATLSILKLLKSLKDEKCMDNRIHSAKSLGFPFIKEISRPHIYGERVGNLTMSFYASCPFTLFLPLNSKIFNKLKSMKQNNLYKYDQIVHSRWALKLYEGEIMAEFPLPSQGFLFNCYSSMAQFSFDQKLLKVCS